MVPGGGVEPQGTKVLADFKSAAFAGSAITAFAESGSDFADHAEREPGALVTCRFTAP